MENASTIIGAMKICTYNKTCEGCPYKHEADCSVVLAHDVVDLLELQQAKIAELEGNLPVATATEA